MFVPRYALITREHGEGYVAKLAGFASFVDRWAEGLREGVSAGRVPTARGVNGSIDAYTALLERDVEEDPLAGQPPPTELTAGDADAWRAAVHAAIRDVVRPTLGRLIEVLRADVLPASRSDKEPGLCHLPDGANSYAGLLWAPTSTTRSAVEVHECGLEQLAKLDDEYRSIAGPVLGGDDPKAMIARLRDDATLRYTSDADLVRDAEAVLARAQAEAGRWFSRLPRAPCRAVAIDRGALAFYTEPSPDGQRGGTFFFNTSDPTAWGRYQLEATTFHEAIPGHHLQLALALELGLHPVRSEIFIMSYGEGWGLYAERLADEMGLYSTPLDRIGMLSADSMRAGRLVVDTGLHAMGWSRQRAVDFLHAHTALTRSAAEAEIDRYIAWPGQATSYMIGRLELDRLRRDARERLGERFDIRHFHDAVLGGGMMPLAALARRVDGWIARTLATWPAK